MSEYEKIHKSVESIKSKVGKFPEKAIILGSGLGRFSKRLQDVIRIPYEEIEGFPLPTVEGHKGEWIIGKLHGVDVLAMSGRFHYYEGHDINKVVFPVRVMVTLGVEQLVITNAAGGVNEDFNPGDLMLISDHLNMTGQNPLRGENILELGPRFPDMTSIYDPYLRDLAKQVARESGFSPQEGVYAFMTGPSYETPAEVKMLRTLGADAVGMSTVPEAITASHAGIKVVGISLITNMAAGVTSESLTHTEVIETARSASEKFEAVAAGLLLRM